MSQTRAVEVKVQAISPGSYCEPIAGEGVSVAFMAVRRSCGESEEGYKEGEKEEEEEEGFKRDRELSELTIWMKRS